jgi:hypothetical protein
MIGVGVYFLMSNQGSRMSWRYTGALLAAVTALLAHGSVHAEIYRCIGQGGKTLFTDSPCPKSMRTADVIAYPPACATADCAERERQQRAEAERQRAAADQLAELRRVRELQDEIARLRSMQAAQSQAVPQETLQEPLYPYYPALIVPGGCNGRGCSQHGHHDHDGAHPQGRRAEVHAERKTGSVPLSRVKPAGSG